MNEVQTELFSLLKVRDGMLVRAGIEKAVREQKGKNKQLQRLVKLLLTGS